MLKQKGERRDRERLVAFVASTMDTNKKFEKLSLDVFSEVICEFTFLQVSVTSSTNERTGVNGRINSVIKRVKQIQR